MICLKLTCLYLSAKRKPPRVLGGITDQRWKASKEANQNRYSKVLAKEEENRKCR